MEANTTNLTPQQTLEEIANRKKDALTYTPIDNIKEPKGIFLQNSTTYQTLSNPNASAHHAFMDKKQPNNRSITQVLWAAMTNISYTSTTIIPTPSGSK